MMHPAGQHSIDGMLRTPMGRRAALALGVRFAYLLSTTVMVARGDLGVEFPPEQVPVLQHRVLVCAAARRRPAIVATEMLHSMVTSTRPTRAEASDVANAIFDGADATLRRVRWVQQPCLRHR